MRRPRSPTAWGWTDEGRAPLAVLAALAAAAVAVAGVVVLRTGGIPNAPSRQRVEIREGRTVRVAATLEPSGFNPNTSKYPGVAVQRWP